MEEQLTKKQRRALKREEKLARRESDQKQKTYNKLIFWSGIFVVMAVSIFGLVKLAPNVDNLSQTASLAANVNENDWMLGGKDAKVELVEYSDFQCPACKSYESVVKAIQSEFGDKIKFVYRHYPLTQIHGNSELASYVAEAAGLQEKFWEMHDAIFENQEEWADMTGGEARDFFIGLAQSLNLDVNQFEKDIDSSKVKDSVKEDAASAISSGVRGTPTFFLNGEQLTNSTLDDMRSKIEAKLSE